MVGQGNKLIFGTTFGYMEPMLKVAPDAKDVKFEHATGYKTAENLRKYGGFIPGYRPGKRTAEHLDYVLTRLTVIGSIYIALVCVLPEILRNPALFAGQFYIGGTSILIVVSVTMDTVAQIQSHLIGHQYEGMIKRARLGGKKK